MSDLNSDSDYHLKHLPKTYQLFPYKASLNWRESAQKFDSNDWIRTFGSGIQISITKIILARCFLLVEAFQQSTMITEAMKYIVLKFAHS